VNLLDSESLKPGGSAFAQLELETPLSMMRGDRVVLRFYSPLFTIGGGTVLDSCAVKHKRYRGELLSYLHALYTAIARHPDRPDGRTMRPMTCPDMTERLCLDHREIEALYGTCWMTDR
jgi:hypothetical protein